MAYKKILLKGDPLQKEAAVYTGATITPGMLLQYVTNENTIRPHQTASGNAAAMVAIENALEGDEILDDYSAGEMCQYVHLRPGDEFLALLAGSSSTSLGTFLVSNGDGYWKAYATETEATSGLGTEESKRSVLAMALEAKSGSSSGDTHVKAVAV